MNQVDFAGLLQRVCRSDTSADPELWSTDSPLWGHCAIVSLLAQDHFGGILVRHSLESVEGLAHLRSHYSNQLPDGSEIDFTLGQFQGSLPSNVAKENYSRERVLSYPDTQRRYNLIKNRLDDAL